jgi:hypothetical protein
LLLLLLACLCEKFDVGVDVGLLDSVGDGMLSMRGSFSPPPQMQHATIADNPA